MFQKRKLKNDDDEDNDKELDEKQGIYDDNDEFEFDYGNGEIVKHNKEEDEENFSDKAIDERNRKWQNQHGRRNFKSSPAIVSSGVGSTKISENERNILLKHAGLNQNKKTKLIKENKDAFIQQRAGINKSDESIAKRVVGDLNIKKKLTK